MEKSVRSIIVKSVEDSRELARTSASEDYVDAQVPSVSSVIARTAVRAGLGAGSPASSPGAAAPARWVTCCSDA